MVTKQNTKAKVIKRYQNRKLYDTQQSCYVTLDDIAKMIRANEDVTVIDNRSKNDITAATLTQIIFEAEKRAAQYSPLFTLRDIIQNGNSSISNYLAKLGAFPKDYAERQAQTAVVSTQPPQETMATSQETPATLEKNKASLEDIKQSLEQRVANAANNLVKGGGRVPTLESDFRRTIEDASLPNSNNSLNGSNGPTPTTD